MDHMEKMLRMMKSDGDTTKAGITESVESAGDAQEMAKWMTVLTEGVKTSDDFQDEVDVDMDKETDADDDVVSPTPDANDYNDSGLYGLEDVITMAGEDDADKVEIEVNGSKVSDNDTGVDVEDLDQVAAVHEEDDPEEEKEEIRKDDDLEDQEREEKLDKVEESLNEDCGCGEECGCETCTAARAMSHDMSDVADGSNSTIPDYDAYQDDGGYTIADLARMAGLDINDEQLKVIVIGKDGVEPQHAPEMEMEEDTTILEPGHSTPDNQEEVDADDYHPTGFTRNTDKKMYRQVNSHGNNPMYHESVEDIFNRLSEAYYKDKKND